MWKKLVRASIIFLLILSFLVINIRFKIVSLPQVSPGALLFGKIGHADGIKLILWIVIDLTFYTIFFYALSSIMIWLYNKFFKEKILRIDESAN